MKNADEIGSLIVLAPSTRSTYKTQGKFDNIQKGQLLKMFNYPLFVSLLFFNQILAINPYCFLASACIRKPALSCRRSDVRVVV